MDLDYVSRTRSGLRDPKTPKANQSGFLVIASVEGRKRTKVVEPAQSVVIGFGTASPILLVQHHNLKSVTSTPPKDDFWGELEKATSHISDTTFKITQKDHAQHGNLENEKDGIDDLASTCANTTGSAFGVRVSAGKDREGRDENNDDEQ
ncbi:hypothetical protein C8F01DRAFT_1259620 [Mycena amicta]|nr:hypothetical protein C8F01DRAFT_1259620 [Mycena amicta]